ncbi:type II secretion system protein F [Rathayibacter sp. Leaf299]|uniref:type II secretion system F family protein n=1 Tax=Rathayibacter TaxID=33886 RepID=UPI0006F7A7AA|nr:MULTISPECIES: type II secretion system F family protein [Rathayibacter]KQQ20865.1 type II secretion system protein F [Rathayibacter sp. Leaf299]MCJ1696654.1 type II secretion system F family protein [Rathayibacter caricis]
MMAVLGAVLCYAAVLVVVFGVLASSRPRLPIERRRPDAGAEDSGLTQLTRSTSEVISAALLKQGWTERLTGALRDAGLKKSPSELLILVAAAVVVAFLLGLLAGSAILGVLLVVVVLGGAVVLLRTLADRRRRRFADQLDGTLQLLASGLRAGHSLLRAIDAASRESESPTAEEFARVVNETRLGRDLNVSLAQMAERMRSEDLSWVGQAIGIHREVGGDLAEVLDQVGHTIRERNQIRRQISALAAEGKMSVYILMAMPFAVIGILSLTSPSYVAKFTEHWLGFVLMVVAAIMFVIGGLWMRRVISFKF